MSDHVPLLSALEGYFDKQLADLPEALHRPVAELFYPLRWDKCDPDYRLRFVEHFDVPPAPETTEKERQFEKEQLFIDNLFALEAQCLQEITDLGNIVCSSVSEHDLKKARIAEAKKKLAQIKQQRCEVRGDYLEADDNAAPSSPCQSVYAAQIISNFRLKMNEDENTAWWKRRMADLEKYSLLECRHGEGKASNKRGAPGLVRGTPANTRAGNHPWRESHGEPGK